MKKEDFEKILEQMNRSATETKPVDWEARKREWLQNLAGFYSQVEEYLADYKASGKLKVAMSKVSITEQYLGNYQADSMAISIAAETVTLMPIGTLLIGTKGRVDMTGPAGSVKFILTGENSNGIRISFSVVGKKQPAREPAQQPIAQEQLVWKIATPPPKVRFIELEQETFLSALTEVLNG